MGNIIITNAIETVANSGITARSEATGYPKINCMIHTNLGRRFQADDNNTNDYLLKFNFGAAQSLAAIALFDCNFNKVQIQGHGSDAWGSPDYAGSSLTVSQNAWTGRYNIFIPLTAFNYQYLRVFIPTGTAEVVTSLSKWQVSSVVPLSTATALTTNMSYGYERTVEQFEKVNRLAGGGFDSFRYSDILQWRGRLIFSHRGVSEETELLTMNRYAINAPIVFYENGSSTALCYLCHRAGYYSGSWLYANLVKGNTIALEEYV